jgi:putative ATP-dependent endonuclease of OLD family
MAMLAAFPDAYKAIIPKGGGPAMKPEDAAKVVLGEGGPGLAVYKDGLTSYGEHMPAYRYHFLSHSKPGTHLQALTKLDDKKIKEGMPAIYRALIEHISSNLKRD